MRRLRSAATGLLLAALCAVRAASQTEPEAGAIRLQFREAPLAQVIREVSAQTGAQFLFDEELTRARVTITGYDLVTRDEALRLLEAALLVNQLAALPTPGGVTKIVPLDLGVASAPWKIEAGSSEVPTTTLVHLRHASVADVFRNLQPWLAGRAVAIPWEPSNSLILAAPELRLRSAVGLVRALDEHPAQQLLVRRLRFRGAEELLPALEAAFGADSRLRRPLRIWSDARSESVIALGHPRDVEDLRDFLSRLDRPAELLGRLAVVPVQYADVEELGALLSQLSAGGKDAESGARIAGAESLAGRPLAVTADPETSRLLLSGDAATLRLARRVVDELDRAPPAITVDGVVYELTLDDTLALGTDFVLREALSRRGLVTLSSVGNPDGLLDVTGLPSPSANSLVRFQDFVSVTNPADATQTISVAARDGVLTALGSQLHARVYLRPHLTALSGEEHTLFAGDNIPIPVAQAGDALGETSADATAQEPELSTAIRQQIQRQDVGVTLRLEPTAGQAGDVRVALELEITELGPPDPALGDVEQVGPVIRKRSLETLLHLRDGEQRAIAGLRDPRISVVRTRAPFLGRIPLLGLLFRRETRQLRQSFLVISLRAQIQRRPEDLLADSIRRRLAFERAIARTRELGELSDAPWAVLLSTRRLHADAETLAQGHADPAHPGHVVSWLSGAEERHDVYLTGYASLAEASEAAFALRQRGFEPEVILNPDGLTEIP